MASPRLFKVEYSLHMTPFCSWPNCMSYVKRAKKPKQGQQEPVLLQIYKILITIQNHYQGRAATDLSWEYGVRVPIWKASGKFHGKLPGGIGETKCRSAEISKKKFLWNKMKNPKNFPFNGPATDLFSMCACVRKYVCLGGNRIPLLFLPLWVTATLHTAIDSVVSSLIAINFKFAPCSSRSPISAHVIGHVRMAYICMCVCIPHVLHSIWMCQILPTRKWNKPEIATLCLFIWCLCNFVHCMHQSSRDSSSTLRLFHFRVPYLSYIVKSKLLK